ncbi:MAG: FtsB family cell division protein [Mycobacteriales bacterium]
MTTRAAILGLALCAVLVMLAYPLQRYLSERGQLAALRASEAAQRARVLTLEHLQQLWQQPSYIEEQARLRLHYVLPGQANYLVAGPTTPSTPAVRREGRASVTADPGAPWYARLWSSDVSAGSAPAPVPPGTRPPKAVAR